MSIVIEPTIEAARVPVLTLAASVAVAEALRELDIAAVIKWPNDVLVAQPGGSEEKIAGILTEIEGEADNVSWAVIGIGINANLDESVLPAGATSIQVLHGKKSRRAITRDVLERFDQLHRDPDSTVARWRELTSTLGREVRVDTPHGRVEGVARDVRANGALVIHTDDSEEVVYAGDCRHLRPRQE